MDEARVLRNPHRGRFADTRRLTELVRDLDARVAGTHATIGGARALLADARERIRRQRGAPPPEAGGPRSQETQRAPRQEERRTSARRATMAAWRRGPSSTRPPAPGNSC